MTMMLAACALGPFVVSVLLTLAVRRWSLRTGFVDIPDGRKAHAQPTPLGGGIAIFGTFLLCSIGVIVAAYALRRFGAPAWVPASLTVHLDGAVGKAATLLAVLGATALLFIVGLIDDRRPLGATLKLVAQVGVSLFITLMIGIRAVEMFGTAPAVVVSTLWIVAVTNAFNFLDNMDGLSAGVAVIVTVVFAVSAALAGQVFVPALTLILAGSIAGFLVFNYPPARIFMGDAGSLVIGFLIGVLTILTTFHDPSRGATPLGVFVPPVVLAVPLYDFLSVIWLRRREGVSVFRGDHRHFSHRLSRRGLSARATVLTVYLATASTALPALLLPNSSWPRSLLILAQCACVVALVAILEQGGARHGPAD